MGRAWPRLAGSLPARRTRPSPGSDGVRGGWTRPPLADHRQDGTIMPALRNEVSSPSGRGGGCVCDLLHAARRSGSLNCVVLDMAGASLDSSAARTSQAGRAEAAWLSQRRPPCPLGVVRGAARPRWRIPCTVTARDAPVTGRTVTRTPVLLRGQHMASCRGPGVPGCGRANKQSSAAGRCGGAWRRWRRRRLSARVPSRTAAPRREPARMTSEPGGTPPSRRGTRTAVGLGRGRRAAGLVLLGLREGVRRAARAGQ